MGPRRAPLLRLISGFVLSGAVATASFSATARQQPVAQPSPTRHPAVPLTLADAWLVPGPAPVPAELQPFEAGMRAFADDRYSEALSLFSDPRLAQTVLAGYAKYFAGLAQMKLSRTAEARAWFERHEPGNPQSALVERWALAAAETAELTGAPASAVPTYLRILDAGPADPPALLARLATAAAAAGDRVREEEALLRLYVEHPTSDQAVGLKGRVEAIRAAATPERARQLDLKELERAERLYSAGRYAEARASFASVRSISDETRDLVGLRLGQCDYFLKKYRAAAVSLEPYVSRGGREPEARHFHAMALRRLGRTTEYRAAVRQLADAFPGNTWAEEALDSLASYHIIADDDEQAIRVFERILREYPSGRRAERAAWKVGWWRYRHGEFREASTVFERAAVAAPRSDYRPAWLYWSARSRTRAGDPEGASATFRLAVTDYRNSYYGRLAQQALGRAADSVRPRAGDDQAPSPGRALPPNTALIRALLATGQHELARGEVEFARRTWGPSPVLDATLAYAHAQLGDLRRGTIYMKRAYPQYIAAGGERLPIEIRRVIFPIDYAELIASYSRSRGLEAALVSALIAQESAFQADVKSSANAYGLMQILPRTGRRLARQDGLRRFSTRMLIDPKVNVRLGTRYFAQLLDEFSGVHLALAGYNAGESRVRQWTAERGTLPTDEFIDDIPFPETQGYVKRILSMVEDYRELYGADLSAALRPRAATSRPAQRSAATGGGASTRLPAAH